MGLPGFYAAAAFLGRSKTDIVPAGFPAPFPWEESIPGEEHLCHDRCLEKCYSVAEKACYDAYINNPEFNVAECIMDDYQVCVANRRCCPATSQSPPH